jgi:outer membrane receptor for ferrienterochelin and colicin
MTKYRHRLLIYCLLQLFISFPLYSQETETPPVELLLSMSLQELMNVKIVTASGYEQPINEAPGIISVMTSQEFEKFGALNLFEVINRMPNVISHLGHSIDSVGIRGGELDPFTNRIAFLLDGYPIRNVGGNGTYYNLLYSFPLGRIKQIEVIRGPGSVLYGTDAFDGVINIITKEGSQKETTLTTTLGEYDTNIYEITTGNRINDFAYHIGLNFSDTDSAPLHSQESEGAVSQPFDISIPQENLSFNSKLSYKNLTINLHSSRSDKFVNFVLDNAFGNVYTKPVDGQFTQLKYFSKATIFSVDHVFEINEKIKWKNAFSFNEEQFQFDVGDITAIQSAGINYYADSLLKVEVNDTFSFLSGFNYRNITSKPTANIPAGYNFDYLALYGELKYRLNKNLLMYLGAQFNKPLGFTGAFVPRFSVSYKLNEKTNVKYSIAQAFKSPAPPDYLIDNRVTPAGGATLFIDKGNPDLDPEIITTHDVQLSYQEEGMNLSLSAFYSEAKDLIVTRPQAIDIGGGVIATFSDFRDNEGKLKTYGFEFEGQFNFLNDFYLTSSFNYNWNELNGTTKNYNLTPNFQFKQGLAYTRPTFSMSSFLIASDAYKQLDDIRGTAATVSFINPEPNMYYDLSANAIVHLDKLYPNLGLPSTSLSLYVRNLLDYDQWQPDLIFHRVESLPGMLGRNFNLQLSIKF